MGRKLMMLGRSVFFALLATQCVVLALYPMHYGEGWFSWLSAIYLLALIAWGLTGCHGGGANYLWLVWLLYSIALATMVGVIFGRIVIPHNLRNGSFYGPNVLKMTLCIAPAEMLLLLNTATVVPEYHEALAELSFTASLDMFDGIEMLEVILENSEESNAVSNDMKKTILGFVCAFFLLSFMDIAQVKLKREEASKLRKTVFYIDSAFRILLNASFLIIRLYLWYNNGRDAAIFITKNVVSLVLIIIRLLLLKGVV